MFIPLDYYRILGLPIQATSDQLRLAHRDRTKQLPRREYSDAAISSRKQLLDEAFAVLVDPARRQGYDATFLARTYEVAPDPERDGVSAPTAIETPSDGYTPSIEVRDDQLVGALLILQELGEYELVLKLGRPFLTGGKASLNGGQFGEPEIVYADIVLTVALACLELGREQWQQGQYENAAEALDTGHQLLVREGLFLGVRSEVQTDLYKLRPYRVLELLALPERQTAERHQGLQLLQDMLQERGGIDGANDDRSGLTIDDFLRFIQQLRGYLTAAEQQVLFEEEARRPSAVATYLAVYALIARGFADRQPALIRRAKQMLLRLSSRQDVHLEQAVCTLLLGQTEEASRALELSREYEPIAFIRDHSQGSPDLLPGLCLYAERWLQDEVFPHFRDLVQKRVALKDYFADRHVQQYLEELPNEPELATDDWALRDAHRSEGPPLAQPATARPRVMVENDFARPYNHLPVASASQPAPSSDRYVVEGGETADALIEVARARIAARTGTTYAAGAEAISGVATMPAAERVTPPSVISPDTAAGATAPRRRRASRSDATTPAGGESLRPRPSRPGRSRKRTWIPIACAAGVAVFGFVGGPLVWNILRSPQTQVARQSEPRLSISPSVALTPTPTIDPNAAVLTAPAAQKLVETWLNAKSSAMGPNHTTAQLEQILAEPKLTEWRNAAADAQANNWYKKYKHTVKVAAIEQSKDKPDQAKVLADVNETTEYYEAGNLRTPAADESLRIQYSLVRTAGKWQIQNWELLR